MRQGQDRILTTHVGSLPRSQAVTDVLFARERGEVRDRAADALTLAEAVREVVRRQVDIGLDIVSDGEMSKISYATYVADRFSGFAGDTPREPGQDLVEFPGLLRKLAERGSTAKYRRPRCVSAITVKDTAPVTADLANLRAAIAAAGALQGFMNAASPGVIALFQPNDYYRTQDEYLEALAAALQSEYEAITRAGIILQRRQECFVSREKRKKGEEDTYEKSVYHRSISELKPPNPSGACIVLAGSIFHSEPFTRNRY